MLHGMRKGTQPSATADKAPFHFECPLTVFKSDGAPEGKQRRIAGIISTDSVDRQNERILQDGLSFQDFVQNGWLNDNHGGKVTDVLGYPEKVQQFSAGETLPDGQKAPANCTWVEGYLLDTPKATEIWELAQALAKTHRRLGYSVEGEIEARTGPEDSTIAKAKVRNVAITHCFPGDVRVLADVEGVSRRHYDGPIVDVDLASGHRVSGTPNHPVLTQRGWVGLGDLDVVRDQVGRTLSDAFSDVLSPFSADDVENVPPTLEQVFSSFVVAGGVDDVRVGNKHDFHGDGSDGEVNVVSAAGLLRDRLESSFNKHLGQSGLSVPKADRLALSAISLALDPDVVVDAPQQGLAGKLSAALPLLLRPFRQILTHCGRQVFGYAKLIGDVPNRLLAHAELPGELATCAAGSVEPRNFSVRLPRQLLVAASGDPSFFANGLDLVVAQPKSIRDLSLLFTREVEFDRFLSDLLGDSGADAGALPLSAGLLDDVIGLIQRNLRQRSALSSSFSFPVILNSLRSLFVGRNRPTNASGSKQAVELADGDSSDAGGLFVGLPASIKLDSIVSLRTRHFSGHVYNLQAKPGWFFADGLACRNCPVNTESRLEILARSLDAQNRILQRSMTLTDAHGSQGPVKPNKAYTGQGAGQVLSRESIGGTSKKRRRKTRTLTRSQAVAYVQSQVPGIPEALARAIVHTTLHPSLGRVLRPETATGD